MSDRRRRKSLSIFRPPLAPLTPIDDGAQPTTPPGILKKRRPTSLAQDQPGSSNPIGQSDIQRTDSKGSLNRLRGKKRPSSLQKSGRPSSLFGSLRSHGEDEELTRTASSPSSMPSLTPIIPDVAAGMVIQHGPLPEVGPMFRKRCPYLVLTDSHLIRFKTQERASDMFPNISASPSPNRMRHSRLSSGSSLPEVPSASDNPHSIPLLHIVAVYKLDDGEPYFSIEVAYFDPHTQHAATMTIQIHDPRDSDTWLTAIRSTASKARMVNAIPFSQSLIEYTARALEQERDYDRHHLHMFMVVQRANKSGKRSSSDDLTKLTSKICILAIGAYKVHLVPLPKTTKAPSSTSLSDLGGELHGIVTLVSVNVQNHDDSFQLWFRPPFQPPIALHLAALCVDEVAVWLRQTAEYLRPEWTEMPFTWEVPPTLNDQLLPVPAEEEENRAFDRTLTAYCAGYGADTSNIVYTVDTTCEDAPAFLLAEPGKFGRPKYSSLELLAIFRALRYNETFKTISFAGISLDNLQGLCDHHGWEHAPFTTRSGTPVDIEHLHQAPVLIQEIRALALKSRRIRRMDFSSCLSRKPSSANSPGSACGICEALFPLCVKQLTNVDWVVLNGIALSDDDIDYLYSAAIEKSCHFRAIEVGSCGLSDRSVQVILECLTEQRATLEAINLSGNYARLEPSNLKEYLHEFPYIKDLDLSYIYRTSGREPLLELDTLLRWKLSRLNLSRASLNTETIMALAAYLKDPQSKTLRHLRLDQCGLTGGVVAGLLEAMTLSTPREMHLYISENYLEKEHEKLCKAISESRTPMSITVTMLVYEEERNFRLFVQAWTNNESTSYLNISKVSLPSEAGTDTVSAMKRMFAENQSLEYLDITGEESHLEVSHFGPGLNKALLGLRQNKKLTLLCVENQRLGMPGANTLASILEENTTLRELHCSGNGFSLQAFTVLVCSLFHNKTLLHLPTMDEDRVTALKKMNREIDSTRETGIRSLTKPTKAMVRRSVGLVPSPLSFYNRVDGEIVAPKKEYSEADRYTMVGSIMNNWDQQINRMQGYLQRNWNIAKGVPPEGTRVSENDRPGTSQSVVTVKEWEGDDATPVAEVDRQLGKGKEMATSDDYEDTRGFDGSDGDMEGALMLAERLKLGD
ncbi:MAG: hypothetical protein Q9202_005173 [Teloschistes flavicans]